VARPRTYELRVGFANYRPVISHLDVYAEAPRSTPETARPAPESQP
jgi:hypothetical protein